MNNELSKIADENLRSPRSGEELGSSKTSESKAKKPDVTDFTEIEVDSLGSDNESDSLDGDFGNYDSVKENEAKEIFDDSI